MDATIRIDLSDILNRTRFLYLFSWRQMATGTDGISSVSKLPWIYFPKNSFHEECANRDFVKGSNQITPNKF